MKKIIVHEDLGIVEIQTCDNPLPQTLIAIDNEVLGNCRQRGLARVLSSIQGEIVRPSLSELYTYVRSVIETGPLNSIRHAIVTSAYETMHMRFLEAVARNRQLQVRVLAQRQEAIVWLQKTMGAA